MGMVYWMGQLAGYVGAKLKSSLDLQNATLLVGLVCLGGGLAGYDWRLALVVVGSLLIAGASLGPILRAVRGLMRNAGAR